MKKKHIFFLCLHLTVVFFALIKAPPAAAQAFQRAFDPFVSNLRGDPYKNIIRLTWEDSPDAVGPVYIYRSAYPFKGTNLLQSGIPAKVPYGTQVYNDEIDSVGTYYYFAIASDLNGLIYDIPIVSKNTVTIEIPQGIPLETTEGILSLEAAILGDKVVITFAARGVKNALIYRSTRPIGSIQQLRSAELLQANITSPFIDYPIPGIKYYYAIVDEEDLARGTAVITHGRNSTGFPVEIAAGRPEFYSQNTVALPLPMVSVQGARWDNSGALLPGEMKKPRAFLRDLEANETGADEIALAAVVNGPFAGKNWEAARIEFIKFIALPWVEETKLRARFYLGQCYYFLNQPDESLSEFLYIQDRFPEETESWILSLYDMMAY